MLHQTQLVNQTYCCLLWSCHLETNSNKERLTKRRMYQPSKHSDVRMTSAPTSALAMLTLACRPYANVMPTLRCGVGLTSCWRRHADHDVFRPNADLMPTILIWAILNVIVLCYLMELGYYTVLSAYNPLRPRDFSVSDDWAATSIGPVRDTEPTV
jgi:hypothetical protein